MVDEIDIESTIENHAGDCRIWYKSYGYSDLREATYLIMKNSDASHEDIFDWMKDNTPLLHSKHKAN